MMIRIFGWQAPVHVKQCVVSNIRASGGCHTQIQCCTLKGGGGDNLTNLSCWDECRRNFIRHLPSPVTLNLKNYLRIETRKRNSGKLITAFSPKFRNSSLSLSFICRGALSRIFWNCSTLSSSRGFIGGFPLFHKTKQFTIRIQVRDTSHLYHTCLEKVSSCHKHLRVIVQTGKRTEVAEHIRFPVSRWFNLKQHLILSFYMRALPCGISSKWNRKQIKQPC